MNANVLNPAESSKLWIDDGILFCEFNHSDRFLTEDRVTKYLSKIETITNGKAMPFVIDIRKFAGNFSPEAAKAFANSATSRNCIIVQAFVANTLNGKLLIGSYRRLFGLKATIRIFDQIEPAVAFCVESQKKPHVDRA